MDGRQQKQEFLEDALEFLQKLIDENEGFAKETDNAKPKLKHVLMAEQFQHFKALTQRELAQCGQGNGGSSLFSLQDVENLLKFYKENEIIREHVDNQLVSLLNRSVSSIADKKKWGFEIFQLWVQKAGLLLDLEVVNISL